MSSYPGGLQPAPGSLLAPRRVVLVTDLSNRTAAVTHDRSGGAA